MKIQSDVDSAEGKNRIYPNSNKDVLSNLRKAQHSRKQENFGATWDGTGFNIETTKTAKLAKVMVKEAGRQT